MSVLLFYSNRERREWWVAQMRERICLHWNYWENIERLFKRKPPTCSRNHTQSQAIFQPRTSRELPRLLGKKAALLERKNAKYHHIQSQVETWIIALSIWQSGDVQLIFKMLLSFFHPFFELCNFIWHGASLHLLKAIYSATSFQKPLFFSPH